MGYPSNWGSGLQADGIFFIARRISRCGEKGEPSPHTSVVGEPTLGGAGRHKAVPADVPLGRENHIGAPPKLGARIVILGLRPNPAFAGSLRSQGIQSEYRRAGKATAK